jgi:hypothetical protein
LKYIKRVNENNVCTFSVSDDPFQDNMKLKLVNASWNGLDDEGALAFSECLANNAVLTELDISRSRIGNVGFGQVMKAFKKNEDLEVLRVSSDGEERMRDF